MSTLLRPGDRCAGHEIVRHLGTGSFAEVYAARAPGGEMRAFKIMAAPGADKIRERFAQEAEALALIVHPNVVRVYDVGAFEDRVWLSLELVEGQTLGQRIRAGGRIPLDDVLHWIQQACDGLAEAHRMEVVHRDLTPDNLLVTADGALKIVDFGMAKLRAFGVETTKEQQIGSAMFMAPELAGRAPASATMDVYSLGHVLYLALAGIHAMGAQPRTMIDIVRWQLSGTSRPLRDVAPWVPADLEALVHDALQKDPARRPASMSAFGRRVRDVRALLRAPQRRAARNVPLPERGEPFAPTVPMPAQDGPVPMPVSVHDGPRAPPAPGPPAPDAVPADRAAMLPSSWPTLPSAAAPATTPAGRWPEAIPLGPPAPAELRSTDVPVESAARRSSVAPRRGPVAAIVVGGVALTAAGWMFLARVRGSAPEPASAPPPAASALAPPAPSTPTSAAPAASTTAATAAPPRLGEPGAPAKMPQRRLPPAGPRPEPRPPAERPTAKNRLFGTTP